jgi:hypothetical protein
MTNYADRWVPGPDAPITVLTHHSGSSLDVITDSERRSLRSIGITAKEAAVKTDSLLRHLLELPSVRVLLAVHPAADAPPVPHVVSSGCRLVFVESVAWPPGRYATTSAGRIYCDGVYIGQSVGPLVAAIRRWQANLPDGHWVSAVVVVHSIGDGEIVLPAASAQDLVWTRSRDAVRAVRAHLPHQPRPASVAAIAALLRAAVGFVGQSLDAGFARPDAR